MLGEFSGPLSHYGVEAVYQPDGQPQEIDLGQSTSALWSRAVYSYDPASQRLTEAETQHQHTVNGVNVWATDADTSYAYDPSGNVLSADDPVTSDNQCFAYDYLARLTVAWSQASACLIRSATTGGRSAGDTAEAIRVGEMSVPDHGCPAATLSARPGFGGPGRRVQGAPDPG